MDKVNNITGCIIAGGKSRRFGEDKRTYVFKGKSLIEHVISAMEQVFEKNIILADDIEMFSHIGIPVYPDIIPDLGPLGGIYTALHHSKTERIFCVASDMPYLDPGFIRYMTSITDKYDIIVPHINNYYEALHSIYSREMFLEIKKNIEDRDYKVIDLFERDNIYLIEEEEVRQVLTSSSQDLQDSDPDPDLCGYADPLIIFQNINYKDDLE